MARPIAVDIDGTMSGRDRVIEGRVFDALRAWNAPVVVGTGKAFPYPVALCEFIGRDPLVIAENGGIVVTDETVEFNGDPDAIDRFLAEYYDAGYDPGWGAVDLVNRWRETEIAIRLNREREPIDALASRHGLEVIDSGYAYHVKSPDVSKGRGLQTIADHLGISTSAFAAIGDSENDVPTFQVAGVAYAVANADDRARTAADHITDGAHADGLLEALTAL